MLRWSSVVLIALLGACDSRTSADSDDVRHASRPAPAPVVKSVPLATLEVAKEIEGVAAILSPDALVQLDSELRAAAIAADFSKSQLARFRTTESLSRQTMENAERQAALEASQLTMLETRLRHTWGDAAPFLEPGARSEVIRRLASGSEALVRLDFPETMGVEPRNVRVAALSGDSKAPVTTFWAASFGNQAMPGVSYFGLIATAPGLKPGDRARLFAEVGSPRQGVVVPHGAVVVFEGRPWCYVETGRDTYERTPVSLEFPVAGGYLIERGIDPHAKVVVRGASTLLSREAGPSERDDDDDGDGDGHGRSPDTEKNAPRSDDNAAASASAKQAASGVPDAD